MARHFPPLAIRFGQAVDMALAMAAAGEVIRNAAPTGSEARRQLTVARLVALYEMAFLRIFIEWERFLEDSLARFICGFHTASGGAVLRIPVRRSLGNAGVYILGGRDYVSWAPRAVVGRAAAAIDSGTIEAVVRSNLARLEGFTAIRNRIAHGSTFARSQFDAATLALMVRHYRGSSPGSCLRDWNRAASPLERWLQTIGTELKHLATQIAA